jgi:glyoxylase-like metal-dependent hydrolase (beta-lactamase superfamily II)
MDIKIFQFNPFQENTYILFDTTGDCAIVDPGCQTQSEREILTDFIDNQKLKPIHLLNTHCHIDHVLGNNFISKHYDLDLAVGSMELDVLAAVYKSAMVYGINYDRSPEPKILLNEGDVVSFGGIELAVLHVPGHSPGHITFIDYQNEIIIGGDVLFRNSIGRTDLPGGNHATLIESITQKLLPLGDNYRVYPGHGPVSSIGYEKNHNPFLIRG